MPPLKTSYFIPFKESIESEALPERFTYPFYYEPHPLCVKAAEELQMHIEEQTIWQHNFDTTGKMFGVLLVKNQKNEVGFLAAFSGKLAGVNHLPLFTPPVYDMLNEKGFYKKGETALNELNAKIKKLQQNPKIKELQDQLEKEKIRAKQSIENFRNTIIESRRKRKEQRTIGKNTLNEKALEKLVNQLATESVNQKNELKRIQQHWEEQLNSVESKWKELNDEIEQLKKERKIASNTLQKRLFSEYLVKRKVYLTFLKKLHKASLPLQQVNVLHQNYFNRHFKKDLPQSLWQNSGGVNRQNQKYVNTNTFILLVRGNVNLY